MTVAPEPLVALPAPLTVREVRHLTLVRSTPIFEQGALCLTYPMPSGLDAVPTGAGDDTFAATGSTDIPNPQPWAARYVQAVVEVLARQRPVSQLARWTSAEVYRELTRLQRAPEQPRDAPSRPPRQAVVSVRVCAVAPDAAEVAARITEGQRSRAIAARLDFRRGRWTCTALAVG
ncbi:MAG TPA: Rv3235 family protein [Nocardioidaceae bacterium]|nr:Rv3235 family protein [Nocardioidaceae bacterium]